MIATRTKRKELKLLKKQNPCFSQSPTCAACLADKMVKPVFLTMQAFCTILVLAQKYAKLSLLGNLLEKTGHCLGVSP